jgi:SAM-dependent methyltransferase
MKCRHCGSGELHSFLDLGFAPPSNAYLREADLSRQQVYLPLRVSVCSDCWLVQTEDYAAAADLFTNDYAYFSSVSAGWSEHAKLYAERIISQLDLNRENLVIEVACNDGYLLKNFCLRGIPCLGVEPTGSTAQMAENQGIPVIRDFFSEDLAEKLAREGRCADLLIGNNVFAHVPDINDFTRGLKVALLPGGTITLEMPHLMRLLEFAQFDTIYHEHFSYFSLYTVDKIFAACGLRVWDVEELPTHGGSIRVYGCHEDDERATKPTVTALMEEEFRRGMRSLKVYRDLQLRAEKIKNEFVGFLIEKKKVGESVLAYGAAAKGNTLLNYAGVRSDLLPGVCDAAESKQGLFMPGSGIPILHPEVLSELRPKYVVILPWNLVDEIVVQESRLRERGTSFVVASPELRLI